MTTIVYKPKIDRYYYLIYIPTNVLMLAGTCLALGSLFALIVMLLSDILVLYFTLSPLFGRVELREDTLFIKFGFFLTREIPYARIREIKKERRIYTDTMLSLKNSLEHITIKYNVYDVTAVSVRDNDEFILSLEERISKKEA